MAKLKIHLKVNTPHLFEKEIYEIIGFNDGLRPQDDFKNNGMLFLLTVSGFLTKITTSYQQCEPKMSLLDRFRISFLDIKEMLLLNMVMVSQNHSDGGKDGFPLMQLFNFVIEKCLALL